MVTGKELHRLTERVRSRLNRELQRSGLARGISKIEHAEPPLFIRSGNFTICRVSLRIRDGVWDSLEKRMVPSVTTYKTENLGVSRKCKGDREIPEIGQSVAFVRAIENAVHDLLGGVPSPLEVFAETPDQRKVRIMH